VTQTNPIGHLLRGVDKATVTPPVLSGATMPGRWAFGGWPGGALKKPEGVAFRPLLSLSRFGSAARPAAGGIGVRSRAFVENKWKIGFVRFFRFGFDGLPRIVTGPYFLDFLVTLRDSTPAN
jgi:hypothetical protein